MPGPFPPTTEHPTSFNPTPIDPRSIDVRSITSGQIRPAPGAGNVFEKVSRGFKRLFPGGPYAAEYGVNDRSAVLQTPYSADPVPEPIPHRDPLTQTTASIGGTGTPILAGFVEDLGEYNAKLTGTYAFGTYEKMRRSDPDVRAGLLGCKLPIQTAKYQIIPGVSAATPGSKLANEIASFVKDNLFNLETMTSSGFYHTQTFEDVIKNALLCLDFGCASDEILWHVDGDKIRARKMAPRLPTTFFRYWPDTDGETLLALEQYGYRGNAYVNVIVPAEKIDFYNYDKEGAYFNGRSILRYCYQPWFLKTNLYRIESIAHERNALGVPIVSMPEQFNVQDQQNMLNLVTRLAAHQSTGALTPAGAKFELVGITGKVREQKLSIQHYSEQILRSFLEGFLAFGTTQTGARAVGSDMMSFFKMNLNSIAHDIVQVMNNGIIRRLVDYNFGDSRIKLPYPRLHHQNIAALDPLETLDRLKSLSQWQNDIVQPDDELENDVRATLGYPLKTKARPRFMPVQIREMAQPVGPETIPDIETGTRPSPADEVGPQHPVDQSSPSAFKPGVQVEPRRALPDKPVEPPTVGGGATAGIHGGKSGLGGNKSKPSSYLKSKVSADDVLRVFRLLASDVSESKRYVMVDFDGVLNRPHGYTADRVEPHVFKPGEFGELIPEGKRMCEELTKMGFCVRILTARKDHKAVSDKLNEWGVPHDQVTSKKIPAIAYIDDRGVNFDMSDPNMVAKVLAAVKQLAKE